MSYKYDDLFDELREHREAISKSFLFYRPVAKYQKLMVLNAAAKYLSGTISKDQLQIIIKTNKFYADALGKSRTKLLIDAVLNEKPSNHRTEEGYVLENGK
jgi:hypothetical protein